MGRGGLRFSLSVIVSSYDVINDVIMSNADCTPGREPRSVAASFLLSSFIRYIHRLTLQLDYFLDISSE